MASDTNKPLTLTLTVADINQILEALGKRPYARVFQLIGRIQQQAAAQLSDAEPGAPERGPGDQPPRG
ncbi:hypothetical protein [Sorangium sp. So ce1182]|uniref:hypothetical protein n=1 Tax=Sorangium sp. So ce1182 TaxID=3133334 RepID=UPI003F5DF11F